MKLIFTCIIFFSIQLIIGQNIFKEGYFIDNSGKKTTCLIKNTGWRSNPTEFKWKASKEGKTEIATIKKIKEFGINNTLKYIRYTVELDLSPIKIGYLEKGRKVHKKTATVFLNTLVEHPEASLFMYQKSDLKKFLYKTENIATPELLVYKKYLITNDDGINKIAENLMYQFQLQNFFPLEGKKKHLYTLSKKRVKKVSRKLSRV